MGTGLYDSVLQQTFLSSFYKDGEHYMSARKRFWTTKHINITVIVVAVVMVIGCLVAVVIQDQQRTAYASAIAKCAQASNNLASTARQYDELIKGEAADVAKLKANQVADDDTLAALKSAMMPTAPRVISCTASDAKSAATQSSELTSTLKWYQTHLGDLQTAIKHVQDSQKTMTDAKAALQKSRDAAQKVYDESLWQVSDESVRTALGTSLDQADGMLADDSTAKPDAMNTLADTLNKQAKTVTDNKNAYLASAAVVANPNASDTTDTTGTDAGVAGADTGVAGTDTGTGVAGTGTDTGTDGTMAGTY